VFKLIQGASTTDILLLNSSTLERATTPDFVLWWNDLILTLFDIGVLLTLAMGVYWAFIA